MKATTLTGKALLASVLSLTLCFAMLLGTTFAWFTDKVTTGANMIISGDLEVALLDEDGNSLENSTTLFQDKNGNTSNLLWEPNATFKTVDMFVKNEGNLALKYKLILNITGEDAAKLLEVVTVTVTMGGETVDIADFEGKLLPKDVSEAIVITTHMDQTADGEYEGLEAALSLTVLATQLDAEFDSIGNDYDDGAVFGTYIELKAGEDLLAAMASAKADMPLTVKLMGDATWSTEGHHGENDITPASSILIDGNGHTITVTGAGVTPLGDKEASMTLQNVKIVDDSVSYDETAWELSYLEMGGKLLNCENVEFVDSIIVSSEKATFTGCSFVGHYDKIETSSTQYGVWVENGNATFADCTFTGTRGLKICDKYAAEVGTVVIDACRFIGLTEKPGVVIDDHDTRDMNITIKNSIFIGCQPGDGGLYIYETDNTIPTLENNTVDNDTVVITDKASLVAAINSAEDGDTVMLASDTVISGYAADQKLIIDKAITLDLNGKTITTECGWGGIDAKGGCTIKNGTINHTGNTAAIKAFQVEAIEDVTIYVTQTEGKIKGGIVVQEGAGCYVGSIKNVNIVGATNGIETYRCGERTNLAIGSMENVSIDATRTGILLSAPIGTVKNCTVRGGEIGIDAYLYGPYSVSITLMGSTVSGATAIYVHDEVGKTNPGTLTVTSDAATQIVGAVTQELEDETAGRVTVSLVG